MLAISKLLNNHITYYIFKYTIYEQLTKNIIHHNKQFKKTQRTTIQSYNATSSKKNYIIKIT